MYGFYLELDCVVCGKRFTEKELDAKSWCILQDNTGPAIEATYHKAHQDCAQGKQEGTISGSYLIFDSNLQLSELNRSYHKK